MKLIRSENQSLIESVGVGDACRYSVSSTQYTAQTANKIPQRSLASIVVGWAGASFDVLQGLVGIEVFGASPTYIRTYIHTYIHVLTYIFSSSITLALYNVCS